MSRVFFDTNIFIYLLEDYGELTGRARQLRDRMRERRDEVVTSTMTVGEAMVRPLSLGDTVWASRYESVFRSPGLVVLPFDRPCSRRYGAIRAGKGVKPPDAIQLACAASYGCNLFVTNDNRLSKNRIEGIDFIVSLEQAVSII